MFKSAEEIFALAAQQSRDGLTLNVSQGQPMLKATTCIGIVNREGVVVAADGRATLGTYIGTDECEKIFALDSHSVLAIAGALSAAQIVAQLLRAQFSFDTDRSEDSYIPPKTRVKGVIRVMRQIGLTSSSSAVLAPLFGAYDLDDKDPKGRIFSIFPDGALKPETEYETTGSGTVTAKPVIETLLDGLGYRGKILADVLSQETAINISLYALYRSRCADGATGGRFSVRCIRKDGIHAISPEEVIEISNRVASEGVR